MKTAITFQNKAIPEIISVLTARLREVETEHEAPDDLVDIRTQLVSTAHSYLQNRYHFGESLFRYHAALPHGAWTPAVDAISLSTGLTDRTLREIIADYMRVESVPQPIVEELLRSGIDPAAKRRRKIVDIAVDAHSHGQSPAQAVRGALVALRQKAPVVGPPPSYIEEPSEEEKDIYQVRLGIRRVLDLVPLDKRLKYLKIAVAEEITALMGEKVERFEVVPKEPTPG